MALTRIAVTALLFVTLAFVPAHARWVEVESENFIFVGETSEKEGKRIVADLESFRGILLTLLGIKDATEVRKVRVYGLDGVRDVRDVTGVKGIAGVYTRAPEYPVFVSTIKGVDEAVRKTSYHEFTHHIINTYTDFYIPRWYNEGFAEYIASFEIGEGMVTIGKPASDFGMVLRVKRWAGLESFTNAITEYTFREGSYSNEGTRAAIFYALSWLGVHYIQSTPELNKGFPSYIKMINEGADPTEAFETSFGITQAEFGDRLQDYWRRNKFRISQARIADFFTVPEATARTISEEEAMAALWEVRVLFSQRPRDGNGGPGTNLRYELDAFIEEYGATPDLIRNSVALAIANENYDEAIEIADRGVEQFPDDITAVRSLADALYHRFDSDREKYREDAIRSRELFARVLDEEPSNPTANSHYPATFEIGDIPPDELAVQAVAFDLSYNRNPVNFDTYLQAARVYGATGQKEFACGLLDKVGRWIRLTDADMTDEQREEFTKRNRKTYVERLDDALATIPGGCAAS